MRVKRERRDGGVESHELSSPPYLNIQHTEEQQQLASVSSS